MAETGVAENTVETIAWAGPIRGQILPADSDESSRGTRRAVRRCNGGSPMQPHPGAGLSRGLAGGQIRDP